MTVKNFRGFDQAEVVPRGHVLLVGEPRAGRTDLLSAIALTLDVEQPRGLSEFDFREGNVGEPIEIEVTLGNLPVDLVHRFLDQIEFWDTTAGVLIESADDPADIPATAEAVVRLAFRGEWDTGESTVLQIRYWPKSSNPATGTYRRTSRRDRAAIPFCLLSGGRPLNLAPRGGFRGFLDEVDPNELTSALERFETGMNAIRADLAAEPIVSNGVATIFEPLWSLLHVTTPSPTSVRLLPDGGGLAALLRSLLPAVDLDDGAGFLPLRRHGSTTSALVTAAEVVATGAARQGIVMIDDFGDSLDSAGAERLSRVLRDKVGQAWVSTRRPETAHAFEAQELVRLAVSLASPVVRSVHYGTLPSTKSEKIAARQLHRQVLPAMTAHAVIVVEGPHDLSAYGALIDRKSTVAAMVPAAHGVRLIDAGGEYGGIDSVDRVSALARQLGLRVVALVDWDSDVAVAADRLSKLIAAADCVVRLPYKVAIEQAILDCTDTAVVAALSDLNAAISLPLDPGWQTLTGAGLKSAAAKALKSKSGLHAEFIHALPDADLPSLALTALERSIACCTDPGSPAHVQL